MIALGDERMSGITMAGPGACEGNASSAIMRDRPGAAQVRATLAAAAAINRLAAAEASAAANR
jgi:hypothetical protein